MSRRSFARLAAVSLAVSMLGCSEAAPRPYVDLSIPFVLSQVNGIDLPYKELTQRFENGVAISDSTIISAGIISFEVNKTLRLQITTRRKRFQGSAVLSDGTTNPIYTGPWTLHGNEVTMSFTVDGVTHSTVATVTGDVLTLDDKETYATSATQTATITRTLTFAR